MRNIPRSLLIVTLGMIIANISSEMYYPLLPLYLESLGATVQEVGLFFTLQVILSICFRILGGWISDYMGRLPTIALGGVFGVGAITGYTVAPTWQWAAVGTLMGAVGSSLVGPSFQAYIAEKSPEGKVSSTYGLINGLFLVCAIIGPLLGGYIVDHYGFKAMMWIAAVIFYIAAGLRVWTARHSSFQIRTLQPASLIRDIRALLVLVFAGGVLTWLFLIDGLVDAGNQLAFPFLPKYITEVGELPKTAYGGLLSLMSLVSALVMWPGGRFADRVGERVSIAMGMAIASGVMFIIVLARSPAVFVLGFALFGLSQAFIGPAFSALLSKAVPKGSLGITWGIFMTAMGILAIPAPTIGGLLYDYIAPSAAFIVAGICTALAIPLILLKLKASAGKTIESETPTEEEAAAVPSQ